MYLRGSQILNVLIVSEVVWARHRILSRSEEMTSKHLYLSPDSTGREHRDNVAVQLLLLHSRQHGKFHAGFTWLVSNTLHKSWCLQACVVLETDRCKDIISQSCLQTLPLFLIHETARTNAIAPWVGEKLLTTNKVVEDVYSKEPSQKRQC